MASQALDENIDPIADSTKQDVVEGEDGEPIAEDAEGEEAGEGEDEAGETRKTLEPLPQVPEYDPNSLEDLAPAERLRINQAISKRELEER